MLACENSRRQHEFPRSKTEIPAIPPSYLFLVINNFTFIKAEGNEIKQTTTPRTGIVSIAFNRNEITYTFE